MLNIGMDYVCIASIGFNKAVKIHAQSVIVLKACSTRTGAECHRLCKVLLVSTALLLINTFFVFFFIQESNQCCISTLQCSVDITVLNICKGQCNCTMPTKACSYYVLYLHGMVVLDNQRQAKDSSKLFANSPNNRISKFSSATLI